MIQRTIVSKNLTLIRRTDGNGIGDACEKDSTDFDKDGIADSKDNCEFTSNPDQKDTDNDKIGDACDKTVGSQFAGTTGLKDSDKDGKLDNEDNCPSTANADQKDTDGDGKIDDFDITTMFDKTTAITVFGFTFNVSYKEFRLQANVNLRIGGKVFYDGEARKVPTTTQNAPAFWADHWTPENPGGKYPRADAPLARETSTFWALDGTQSRINNAVLSYQMPKRISEKLRIPDLRIMLTGTNLVNIINPYKYKDPYTSNYASYPTLRTVSVGVNVGL